jgi:hypothetical protein
MVTTFNSSKELSSDLSGTDMIEFSNTKLLHDINTIILAKIIEVDLPTKRLIVRSLINGVDTHDQPISPPQIYDVPYCAQRGGNAGIITEYKTGDTVVIGFCQRQIDITKNTMEQSTPNLTRFHALNDAVVLSHWSNNEPTIFIKITDDGIDIQTLNKPLSITTTGDINLTANNVTMNATTKFQVNSPDIELNGNSKIIGTLTIGNTIINTTGIQNSSGTLIDSVPFLLHTHNGVTTGTGVTGPVT